VATVVSGPSADLSLTSKLREIKEAKDAGLLSSAEYENARKQAINSFAGGGGSHTVTNQPSIQVAAAVVNNSQPTPEFTPRAPSSASVVNNPSTVSTEAIAGTYCCCCFAPPFGYGWTMVVADGPNKIQQWGCCTIGLLGGLCVGGEIRERIPNTNSFRNVKDHKNVTTFSDTGACNDFSAFFKLSQYHGDDARFQHIPAADIAGKWCCCCWFPGLACSTFSKTAINDNELKHEGVACWNGIPVCGSERRLRIPGTNSFRKSDDEGNIDWYLNKSCVGNGCSVSWKS